MLLIPAARSITTQVQIVVELFNISVLDLTSGTVRLQLQQLDLQTRGIRAADALHAASAIAFDADLLVSADDALLSLDGVLMNNPTGVGATISVTVKAVLVALIAIGVVPWNDGQVNALALAVAAVVDLAVYLGLIKPHVTDLTTQVTAATSTQPPTAGLR